MGYSWILWAAWDPCGLPGWYPYTGPAWFPRTKSCGSRVGYPAGTRTGTRRVTHAGPVWVTRRVPAGLPGGYPHTGPAWSPRTKSCGSRTGIPCGTQIRDITGPVRDPCQCVDWVVCCRVQKNPVVKKKPNPGGFFFGFYRVLLGFGFYWVFLDAQHQRLSK